MKFPASCESLLYECVFVLCEENDKKLKNLSTCFLLFDLYNMPKVDKSMQYSHNSLISWLLYGVSRVLTITPNLKATSKNEN